MKEIQYQSFSFATHKKNWGRNCANVCQFELTFKCGLRCKHCYTDCYNKQKFVKDELDTRKIQLILDKVYDAGVIWLCLTGGDPLVRKDFLEIYAYAKNKGFIVTVFTNAYSMTEEIADYLEKSPPFVIEITLNAVTKAMYEDMSQVKGSFEKAMEGIRMITSRKLRLKIKTQVTNDNLAAMPAIKAFVENLGLTFNLSSILRARLDKDLTPCTLRIKPEEVLGLAKRLGEEEDKVMDDDCRSKPGAESDTPETAPKNRKTNTPFFPCAISGGDTVYIDPYGNSVPCICIREPKISLCRENIQQAQKDIMTWIKTRTFTTDSKCKTCQISDICWRCPGKALVEKGNLEEEMEWYCALARGMTAGIS